MNELRGFVGIGQPHLLLVEDQEIPTITMVGILEAAGYRVMAVDSLAAARSAIEHNDFHLILLDLTLPDGTGFSLLEETPAPPRGPHIMIVTADHSLETAVEALRLGAHDYLSKPYRTEEVLHRVHKALEHRQMLAGNALRRRLDRLEDHSRGIVQLFSSAMEDLYGKAQRVAPLETLPVLIRGETGVGKEHICRWIHESSPRAEEPYMTLNCALLDRHLIGSELFGHERGAFTGAAERRQGLFELARQGTLLLDEVAEMPIDVQPAFLRVLETRRFRRLGGSTELETGVRILCSTNADIEKLAQEGKFREDLLYRLNGVELVVPPLRQRGEDIQTLSQQFLARVGLSVHRELSFSESALRRLLEYPWPGNIRELRHVVERSAALSTGGVIRGRDLLLPDLAAPLETQREDATVLEAENPTDETTFPTLAEVERRHIERAMQRAKGNRTHAARLLGIARSTLLRRQ